MKKTRLQKGITLVALIITIVVILILAAVTISVLSDSGIINRAKNAQTEYEIAEEKEKVTLAANEAFLSGLGTITEEELEIALDSNFGAGEYSIDSSNSEYFTVTITKSGRVYKVYKSSGEVDAPTGGEDSDPVEVLGKATVGVKVTKNSTIDGQAYSSTNPIIPAGFTAINTGTSNWDSTSGPEVDNGLVIRDESGNEFVWVPVTDDIDVNGYRVGTKFNREPDVITGNGNQYDAVLTNIEKAGCTEDLNDDGIVNVSDFKIKLTNEYKSMAESVNKYDGFYVGRFETSRNGATPQSKRSTAVSGSGELVKTAIENWYSVYELNNRYSTSSAKGSVIWGIQYDKMMIWMGDVVNTTIVGYNKETTCGTAPEDVINNVYDIYGNSKEWSLEAYGTGQRKVRGGSNFYYNTPPVEYINQVPVDFAYGSRLALYVM